MTHPTSDSFDLLVLGGGPGGYVAAIRARQLGLRVAVVEAGQWGGVCLQVGCIPSKALIEDATLARILTAAGARTDYAAAHARSRRVVAGRVKGLAYLMRKNEIATFDGWGRFIDPHSLLVTTAEGERRLGFARAVIATGATPRLLPGTVVGPRVFTHREALLAPALGDSLIVIGGGPVGVEWAYVARSFGVKVTVVEALGQLLPGEDPEVAAELLRAFRHLGIEVRLGTRVARLSDTGDGVRVVVTNQDSDGDSDGDATLDAAGALQAIGFLPRTTGYGLEATGVALDARGFIAVDAKMRTSVAHIHAIGDVTGRLMLAHAAEAMGHVAAEAAAGQAPRALDFAMIPRIVYAEPQVASFGLTSAEATARGIAAATFKFPFSASGRAQAAGAPGGFVKLLADPAGQLLGAHLVGNGVAELLPELTLAQAHGLPVTAIAHNVHAHPTLGEAVRDAALGVAGLSINL